MKIKLLSAKYGIIGMYVLRIVSLVIIGYISRSSVLPQMFSKKGVEAYQVIIPMVLIALIYSSKYLIAKAEKRINFLIDNFEDTAKWSRTKGKYGQINEYGLLNIGLMLKRGSDDALGDLQKMIGLDAVKKEVLKMKTLYEYEAVHPNQASKSNVARHLLFLGNPGSGKTVVASIFSGLLYQYGRIKYNMYLPITAADLAGDAHGQTALRMESLFKKCKGGVIFIDEAYALYQADSVTASEIIAQLLVQMEANPDTVVIFAGYTNEMKQFINMNPGIASRIATTIEFPDYNAYELVEITKLFFAEKNLTLTNEATVVLQAIYQEKLNLNEPNFSNGRYARNCFDKIYQQHALSFQLSNMNQDANLITISDILEIKDLLINQQ